MRNVRLFDAVLACVISFSLSGVSLAASTQASTYVCAETLTDSSCLIGATDPSTSTVELSINDAGGSGSTFYGQAKADADYGSLKVYAEAHLAGYTDIFSSYSGLPPNINIPIPTPAYAVASVLDSWTFSSGVVAGQPQIDAIARMGWIIDGTMSANAVDAAYLSMGNPQFGYRVAFLTPTVVSEVVWFEFPIKLGTEYAFSSQLVANLWSRGVPSPGVSDYDGLVDLYNTATLDSILITDTNYNPIPGITMTSESGTAYPLSPLNAVPLPPAIWLFGSGLLGLVGMARRKKA